MTKALVAYHHTTWGGVYYSSDIDFTNSAVQPTWTRYATTGLANNLVKVMQNDPVDPYGKVYVQLDNDDVYLWNGSSWDKIMDLATAKTLTGFASGIMGYIAQDKTITGHIYIPVASGVVGGAPNLLKSVDYGANWSVMSGIITSGVPNSLIDGASVSNGKVWYCSSNIYRSLFHYDGAVWRGDYNIWPSSGNGGQINIDPTDPNSCYYPESASDFDLVKYYWDTGVLAYGETTCQNGSTLARCYELTSATKGAGAHWLSGTTNGKQRIIRDEPTTNFKMYQTADGWANLLEASPTSWHATIEVDAIAQAAALEDDTYVLIAGGKTPAGAGKARVFAWIATNNTGTSTPWHVSGTNHATGPGYTDAIPSVDAAYTAVYGVFVGEAPATQGVYVYADEQGDITDIPDYDGLGTPLFGDRSSWRDLPADGYDIYHAQDVQALTPQIHAPWDEASPPAAGYGIISDGAKWEVSSDEIALVGDLHDAVTLDVDAAVILDLTGQEIGLDVQNANTVLAGPASGAANEPTFRALTLANGDITDVDITGAGTGDIIYKPAVGDWVDYPLGIGSAIINDGSSIKIGDIVNGDYIQIDINTGEVQLTGEATAWEDLRVEPTVRAAAGAGVPTFEKYFDDLAGTSKGVYLYSFTDESVAGNEKEVFFTMQMPHAWKVGSDISFHVHFVPAATVASSDIIFGLEYTWKGIGEVFGDTTIIYSSTTLLPDDANITAGKHYLAEFTDISPGTTASSLSSILIGRLFRNSSAAGDTYTDKVGLLYIDGHYQVDSFGSFDEYSKDVLLSDSDGETLLDSDGIELTE